MSKHLACALTCAPRPRQLRDHLMLVLGRLTFFKPNVFVEMSTVIDDVIRESGFNPDSLPISWGRDRKSRSNDGDGGGIDRNIAFAFRYGYRDYNPPLTVRGPETGLWGLTEAGVTLAKKLTPVPLPRPLTFSEPLLRALGKLSGHSQAQMPRIDAMRAVITESGHNPDSAPLGWMYLAPNGQPKLYEALRWLARSMSTLVDTSIRGQWSLTMLGLERAAKLNGVTLLRQVKPEVKTSTGPNVTSQWFSTHLTPPRGRSESVLMGMMKMALAKHLPISSQRGLVEDHIQNFMVRVIRRDSFALVLAEGEEIPYSKVTYYCVNSGRTDVRDMGTEPVCREMMGARTDHERQVRREQGFGFTLDDGRGPQRDTDGSHILPNMTVVQDMENGVDFESLWGQIVEAVRVAKPAAWPRYSGILKMKFEGFSTQEIAEKEGVSLCRAAKMIATARQIVRDSNFAI